MNVKFKNGTVKTCASPTEQKIVKAGVDAGWLLSFYLICDITSDEVDALLIPNNISELTFTSEEKLITEGETNTQEPKVFTLSGYDKVSSTVIRYSEDKDKTKVEIQLIRGV